MGCHERIIEDGKYAYADRWQENSRDTTVMAPAVESRWHSPISTKKRSFSGRCYPLSR